MLRNVAILGLLLATLLVRHASAGSPPQLPPEVLSGLLTELVRTSLPPTYEKQDDWGRTRDITVGVEVHGKPWKPRVERRKKTVEHGTWKRYRAVLVDPERQLQVVVTQIDTTQPGRVRLTLVLDARLELWGQLRRYNRGVHVITLTTEGSTRVRVAVDCDVALQLDGLAVVVAPTVLATRLELHEFELRRLGEIEGELADEIGDGLRHLIEDQLGSKELTAKLNASIAKRQDRLRLDPAELASLMLPPAPANPGR